MKKILFITTILLTLGFFIPNPVFAATDCNKNSVLPPVPPFTSTCPAMGLNNNMVIWAYAFDEDKSWLGGVSVSFTWSISNPNLGTFTTAGSATCTGISGTPPSQCQENTTAGFSSVNLHSSNIIVTSATVNVTDIYLGKPSSKTFNISSACTDAPKLYYGIAGVSKTGAGNFQYSTAEVLLTCQPEYRLYEGDGRK